MSFTAVHVTELDKTFSKGTSIINFHMQILKELSVPATKGSSIFWQKIIHYIRLHYENTSTHPCYTQIKNRLSFSQQNKSEKKHQLIRITIKFLHIKQSLLVNFMLKNSRCICEQWHLTEKKDFLQSQRTPVQHKF